MVRWLFAGILAVYSILGAELVISTRHSAELTQSLNLARQEHIQAACQHIASSKILADIPSLQLEHILVDHKHKLLYCYVPKVACTNWKRIFMILSSKWNDSSVLDIPASLAHSPGMFPTLADAKLEDRIEMVESYHKLIFVRNPFERLLSAYRNKLEGDSDSAKYFQNRVGRRIVKAFRANPSNESLETGDDVTFNEFAQFVTSRDNEFADVVSNEHWKPIASLCHPCLLKYTIVGKYETLLDDSLLALATLNATHIPFPATRTSHTADRLREYFAQLPLHLIRRLYMLYEYDFHIFDYSLANVVGFEIGR